MQTQEPEIKLNIDLNFTGEIIFEDFRLCIYRGYLRIEDLTNAGKRGKTCKVYKAYTGYHDEDNLILNLICKIKYQGIQEALKDPLFKLEEVKGINISPDYPEYSFTRYISTKETTTDDLGHPVIYTNEKAVFSLNIRAENGTFEIRLRDLTDHYNEPTSIFCRHNKTDRAKVYKCIAENFEAIKELKSYSEVTNFIKSNTGVYLHSYCAVD